MWCIAESKRYFLSNTDHSGCSYCHSPLSLGKPIAHVGPTEKMLPLCKNTLLGGVLTRVQVIRSKGLDYFNQSFIPKFNNLTIGGLLLTLVLIFSFQGDVILSNPLHIVLIAVPLIIQTYFIFFIAYLSAKKLRLPHDVAAPGGMIGASNFFELAVAVAIALFGTSSPVVLATIVGVLVEVPVMLSLVKFANRTTQWFPATRSM